MPLKNYSLAYHLKNHTSIPSGPPAAHNQAWSTITATPTTLAGYGITDAAPLVHGVDRYYLPYSDSSIKNSWAKTTLTYTPNDGGIDKWYSTSAYNNRFRVHTNDGSGFVTSSEIGVRFSSTPTPSRTADYGGLQMIAYDVQANDSYGAICELNSNYMTRLSSENGINLLIDVNNDTSIYFGTNAKIRAKIDSTASLDLYQKNSTYAILVSHADSAHGITDILPTTARFGVLTGLSTGNGAGHTRIIGVNCEGENIDRYGLMFEGIVTNAATSIAHVFDGAAGSGTGRAALTAGNIFAITNNSSARLSVNYLGGLRTVGAIQAQSEAGAFGIATYAAYCMGKISGATAAEYASFTAGRYNKSNLPFGIFGIGDTGSARILYVGGGGGWGSPACTRTIFYAQAAYTENEVGITQEMEINTNGVAIEDCTAGYVAYTDANKTLKSSGIYRGAATQYAIGGTTVGSDMFRVTGQYAYYRAVTSASDGAAGYYLNNELAPDPAYLSFTLYGSAVTGTIEGYNRANMGFFLGTRLSAMMFYTSTASDIVFAPNGTKRLTIASAGIITMAGALTGTSGEFSSTLQCTTIKCTSLTDGYIPYHVSDASGLANSICQVDATDLTVNGGAYIKGSDFRITTSQNPAFAMFTNSTGATAGTPYFFLRGNRNSGTGALWYMDVYNYAASDTVANLTVYRDNADDAGAFDFQTQAAGGALTSRMIITSAGYVGIGTTAPASTIDVVGTSRFGDSSTNYTAISATGDVSFVGSAGLYPRRIRQDEPPAAGTGATQIDTGEFVMWCDSNDSDKTYIVYNDATKGIVKIALA